MPDRHSCSLQCKGWHVCRVCRLDLQDAPVRLRSLLLMIRKQLERLPQHSKADCSAGEAVLY